MVDRTGILICSLMEDKRSCSPVCICLLLGGGDWGLDGDGRCVTPIFIKQDC